MTTYASFDDFWPHYVGEHRHPICRALHYTGTLLGIGSAVLGCVTLNPLLVVAAPIIGYAFSWTGHFVVEGNRPASWTNPIYSFMGDFKMLALALRGKMDEEVVRLYGSTHPAADAPLLIHERAPAQPEPAKRSVDTHAPL